MGICLGGAGLTAYFWPVALVFGGLAWVGLIFQEWSGRRYHCPECGVRISNRPAPPSAPIEYH